MMKTRSELLQDIFKTTFEIERNYPELYIFLDEMPDTLPDGPHPNVNDYALEEYLESLDELIKNHKKLLRTTP